MKNFYRLAITISLLLAVGLACEFTTANLSDVNFATDEKNTEKITSAEQGEKIYAHSSVNNAGGEHTVRWKVTNSDGEEIKLPENEMKTEGSRSVFLTLTLNPRVFSPGKYKFQVTLLNKDGEKEIESKTGTLEVTK